MILMKSFLISTGVFDGYDVCILSLLIMIL